MLNLDQQKITLNVETIAARTKVSNYVLQGAEVSTWQDYLLDGLVVQLSRKIATEKLGSVTRTHDFASPASWWQHLKKTHAPSWFLSRWPVEYTTETVNLTVDVLAVYPEIAIPPGRKSLGVSFLTTRES